MLKKEKRLTKNKEINNVFNPSAGGGKSSYDKLLGIKTTKNNLENSRFTILINLKVSKKAVERNRIKRKISEIIRLKLDKIKKGYDSVIICLPEIREREYSEIEKSILRNLKRLNLLLK